MRVVLLVSSLGLAAVAGAAILAQPGTRGIRLADMTWREASDALQPATVVVIPLGAGSKEHGPHLKLGNDAIMAEYLTSRVLEVSDVVVAPSLPYHFYPAFVEYPGSATLTADTARSLTIEIAIGLAS